MTRRFDTSITNILDAQKEYCLQKGERPVFLSDWNASSSSIYSPVLDFSSSKEQLQEYYFWTDELSYRDFFLEFYTEAFGEEFAKEEFLIAANGTSAMALALQGVHDYGVDSVLLIAPVYFTVLNILDTLKINVFEYSPTIEDNFLPDLGYLDSVLRKNTIQAIVLTNPVFGTGVEYTTELIQGIARLAHERNVWLIMDYMYGGMPWDAKKDEEYLFKNDVLSALRICEKFVLIESVSKRLMLNGCKTALVFSNRKFVRKMMGLSISSIGSMCSTQLQAFREIYAKQNRNEVVRSIKRTAIRSERQYGKLVSMLSVYDKCFISNCNNGYFALVEIPKRSDIDDLEYSIEIIEKCGIVTIPHSRYLYFHDEYYSFRINLLIEDVCLIEGVDRLRILLKGL